MWKTYYCPERLLAANEEYPNLKHGVDVLALHRHEYSRWENCLLFVFSVYFVTTVSFLAIWAVHKVKIGSDHAFVPNKENVNIQERLKKQRKLEMQGKKLHTDNVLQEIDKNIKERLIKNPRLEVTRIAHDDNK